jgi:uncharacterized protein
MNKSISIFSANLLFTITMVLVITLGSLVQTANLGWGLIVTEIFLIALPTWLFLRARGVPLKDGLRLQPISVATVVLCLILGVSIYLFGSIIEGVMAQLTGLESVTIQSNLLPKTGWEMLIYFAALAIFAPLCEEILFRGAIQQSYENRKRAGFAITMTALLFAFYHFRLSGLPALLPIAFVLGFVVWRTKSIYAGMLIHFANNGASALNSIHYFSTGKGLPFISLWSAAGGLVVTMVVLFILSKLHPVHLPEARAAVSDSPTPPRRMSWLATYWPLIPAGALYLSIAGLTLAVTLVPDLVPSTKLEYGIPALISPVKSHYEIANQGGEVVGEMDCTLAPDGPDIHLSCDRTIRAYELKIGNSFYQDGNHADVLEMAWNAKTMQLLIFAFERKYEDGTVQISKVHEGKLISSDSAGTQEVELGESDLLELEWVWRVALLKANAGQRFQTPFGYLMTWDNQKNRSSPMIKNEILKVYDDERIVLPKGDVSGRKLTLAGGAAWYAKEDAQAGLLRPVKFDDGMVVYTLIADGR